MRDYIVVIPARYKSSRLPGKPLVELCGIPMIVRTWRQCAKVIAAESIYVATDNISIKVVCNDWGIPVIMTDENCLTGTDRVAEVSRQIKARTYINVQGDEPVFDPKDLERMIEAVSRHPNEVLNGFCPIMNDLQYQNPSIPKLVMRPDGRLLYMSRSSLPGNKHQRLIESWRQVCLYAFPKAALEIFSSIQSKTPLEEIEDIEILRFLEMGLDVRMIPMSDSSFAVDNPEDVLVAEKLIRLRGL